ncbi:MAG: type II toxin-antitoxin system RelE/ParE family toxin [Terracidiphilus sp.]|jgi:plasmid maintenance system killer protein
MALHCIWLLKKAIGGSSFTAWHPLKGDLKGHSSVSVNGNWRLTFAFEGEDAILVDYQDYH